MERYEVFGRRDHDSEVQRLGSLNADSLQAAKASAWYTFDGFAGVELWLVPRDGIVAVKRPAEVTEDRVLQEILRRGGSDR